ncbi:MAG: hypothetical protein KGJ93_04690 [Patescibacteria group bacterium]|nr:hypothetical protein [Patescibacteria group bacterium]
MGRKANCKEVTVVKTPFSEFARLLYLYVGCFSKDDWHIQALGECPKLLVAAWSELGDKLRAAAAEVIWEEKYLLYLTLVVDARHPWVDKELLKDSRSLIGI